MYLASAKLGATYLYFLLYQEIVANPTLKIKLEVIFLSDGLPAQFTSVKPCMFTPFVHLYHNPY